MHDPNRPQPPRVEPGTFSTQDQPGKPPSDAIVLFDGTEASLANWETDKTPPEPVKWIVKDGALQCVKDGGSIRSRALLGDCQLHVEWSAPAEPRGSGQGRGNSGIFLAGDTEIQVLDNYENPTYADGFAGSVYGVNPPMANAVRPPGQWQVYDIVFRRPVYKDGKEVDPGRVTVFVNGVLVQDATPPEGGGGHRARTKARPFPESAPLKLQDHGDPVRFRNIWYRPLPPRSVEGGTDGFLTKEAAAEKRKSIAAEIRQDAETKSGTARLLRLMESFVYAPDDGAAAAIADLSGAWLKELHAAGADLEAKKGEILQVRNAANYLLRHRLAPEGFALKADIDKIVSAQGWDEK